MLKLICSACAVAVILTFTPAQANAAPAEGVGTASAAHVRYTSCNRNTYKTKVRSVTGVQFVGISRMWPHTYPGATVIRQGKRVRTDHHRTISADVSSTVGASVSAGGILKKVVHVFAEVHGETTYSGSLKNTTHETSTVTSHTTTRIPAGKTVVWFVGHKRVKGHFEYSSCDYSASEPRDTGRITWHSGSWKSYSIREDGGQRCDFQANTSVAKAAKKIGCS